ncbi:MAG: FAD-binding oxidoreductase [Halioglobus sp.]|nr:FAD-binding oxidoreductase [Halioglobus sp.]
MNARQHDSKKRQLASALRLQSEGQVRLGKNTSNLFRDREKQGGDSPRLDVRGFTDVLRVNPGEQWVEVEGMTTYADLVDVTLAQGVLPCVVPQLKTITIGGAIAGVGIESSSFRYGLSHETVLEMDVLTGTGEIVTCTPDNQHADLFFGLPNSYGTLGYVLKLRARTVSAKPYVQLEHRRHHDPVDLFNDLQAHSTDADFLDGTVFAEDELYLTVGRFVEDAPWTSDYTFENIYYRSIRENTIDYLTVADYIWRWDTDWFWCSRNLYAQQPWLRRLLGRKRLNSETYTRVMRWNSRWQLTRRLSRLRGLHPESVIQDVDIPVDRAPEFLDFFHKEIGINPIWICPMKSYRDDVCFPLFPTNPGTLYINFGFWDVVNSRQSRPAGYLNRKIEQKVQELGGIKSLYSDSFFEPDEFWAIYSRPVYDELKARYDPDNKFGDLYQKTVLRQ